MKDNPRLPALTIRRKPKVSEEELDEILRNQRFVRLLLGVFYNSNDYENLKNK